MQIRVPLRDPDSLSTTFSVISCQIKLCIIPVKTFAQKVNYKWQGDDGNKWLRDDQKAHLRAEKGKHLESLPNKNQRG